jgi:hypothetical protein
MGVEPLTHPPGGTAGIPTARARTRTASAGVKPTSVREAKIVNSRTDVGSVAEEATRPHYANVADQRVFASRGLVKHSGDHCAA